MGDCFGKTALAMTYWELLRASKGYQRGLQNLLILLESRDAKRFDSVPDMLCMYTSKTHTKQV
jgi:hypothetical protein